MANTTDKSILTAAGKALLAQLNAEEKPLIIDKMIFANVPNRPEYPQPDDVVPTDHVVHQEGVEQRGRLSADSVIYSTTLTSDVGPFEFNWTGAYCSEYGVLVTIDHHALTPKSADEPGVAGNTLVRSVVLEYKDIAEITNITVDASSWQYNATPRMKKMDDDVAQAIIDQNGKDWFIEDGFLVTPQAGAFNIKAGAGYVSGNRVTLEFDRNVQVPNKPSFIYVDAHREGTPTGEQVTLFDFVVTAEEKDDYTDANGVKHYVCKIAQVLADGTVVDLRLDSKQADKTYVGYLAGYRWEDYVGTKSVADRIYVYQARNEAGESSGPSLRLFDPEGGNILEVEPNYFVFHSENPINIRQLGLKCDGVKDESDELVDALSKAPVIRIDEFARIRITKEITLPVNTGKIIGGGRIILDGDAARIRTTSNLSNPVAVKTGVQFENNAYEIDLGGDFTGKFLFIENGLPWFIHEASQPDVTPNSMNPLGYTRYDDDFKTERKGVYKVVGYNATNGKSVLNMPTNFNAENATVTIHEEVNHPEFEYIQFSHVNRGKLSEIGSISLSGCFGSGFSRCTFENVGAVRYYWLNSRCYFTDNTLETDGGLWLSVNTRQCNVSSNKIDHSGDSDGAIVVYYNSCENTVSNNTIASFKKDGDLFGKWGVITHSASDYNSITGNVITSYSGISDFFANKGNVFFGNTINGQRGEISNYCFDTTISTNTINDAENITVAGSEIVNINGNTIRQAYNSKFDMLVDLYDASEKPFGYEGFFGLVCNTLNIDSNTIIGSGRKVSVRDYISALSNGENDFDLSRYENESNYCIGSSLCRVLKVNIRNNKIIHFDCAVLNYSSLTTVGESDIKSQGNTYENCEVAFAQSSEATSALKGISSSLDYFRNVNIACVTRNAWFYIRGCLAKEIDSIIAICGKRENLYATIIDIDNLVENETKSFKHYDFSGQWLEYYREGVIENARHLKASNVPYGAQYYQISDNLHKAQTHVFINKMNTFDGSIGNVTVKRTISEQQYG